jgi:GTP-binding protein
MRKQHPDAVKATNENDKPTAAAEAVYRPEAQFLTSAAHFEQLPPPKGDEYCILGRSNVGKSSFINHVLQNQNLAKVSKKPGKTTLANLYRIDGDMYWVDLPGYGYAHASHAEKARWSKLIADYCTKRDNLRGVIWLLDIRHPGTDADREALTWLESTGLPRFPVFTKCDKESQQAVAANRRTYRQGFGLQSEGVCYTTARHKSRQNFWDAFGRWVNQLES